MSTGLLTPPRHHTEPQLPPPSIRLEQEQVRAAEKRQARRVRRLELAWYDNEWGYSNRLLELAEKVLVEQPAFAS